MDARVTRDIIKISNTLRQKYRALKRSLQESEEASKRHFAPLLTPLKEIKEEIKSRPAVNPPIEKEKEEDVLPPLFQPMQHKVEEEEEDDVSYSPELEETTLFPQTSGMSTPLQREEEDEEEEDLEGGLEKVHEYVKTPLGKTKLEEILKTTGELHRPYLEMLYKGNAKKLDDRFGIRILPSGRTVIGDKKL